MKWNKFDEKQPDMGVNVLLCTKDDKIIIGTNNPNWIIINGSPPIHKSMIKYWMKLPSIPTDDEQLK